jgi:threonine/homoserine/homoserine lactone efflux protein
MKISRMFHLQNIYLFFVASLMLNLTPGNDMLYVASRSISQGSKAGLISALGIFCGCFVHIFAAVFGLSLIIAKSAWLFSLIKFAGAGYLVYLGMNALINKSAASRAGMDVPKLNPWKLFKQGVLTNALNPKVAIFFLSFLPQFVDPKSSHVKMDLAMLGLWFAAQGTLVLMVVAMVLGKSGNFFKDNPKVWFIQEKLTGFILIGLGIKVALTAKR